MLSSTLRIVLILLILNKLDPNISTLWDFFPKFSPILEDLGLLVPRYIYFVLILVLRLGIVTIHSAILNINWHEISLIIRKLVQELPFLTNLFTI